MLTDRRAFEGDTAVGVMNAILTEDPPSHSSGLPAADRLVRRCMEKQPEERFQSGHDLAVALEAIRQSVVFEFPDGFRHDFGISGWKVVETADGQWIYYLKKFWEGNVWMLEFAAGP